MLNERLEYEQYTYTIKDCRNPVIRLKYFSLIKNGFTGVSRAMEIIARHFLFDFDPGRTSEEKIEFARMALNAWLGFLEESDKQEPEIEAIRNWLPDYIMHVVCKDNEDSTENRKRKDDAGPGALKSLREKKNAWQQKLFNSDSERNEILIDRCIANALRSGALREYVLACRKEPVWGENLKDRNDKNNKERRTVVKGKKEDILKLTVACLLEMHKRADAETTYQTNPAVHVTTADVWNWASRKKPPLKGQVEGWNAGEKKIIFHRTSLWGDEAGGYRKTISKYRLDDEWLRVYGWRILPLPEGSSADELLSDGEWACIYSDQGAGERLAETRRDSD